MGLETGTFINDLNASNPVGASDPKSQGDDHIRLIKSTILATFANITGAVTATHTQLNQLASLAAVSVLGRSANSAGAPAAIAAAANDRILRRVSNALDFGQLTAGMFPSSAIVPDADLSSNIPRLDAANTFTGNPQEISHATPRWKLNATGAGADGKIWDWINNAGSLQIRTRTDADGIGSVAVQIDRSGTTVSSVTVNAPLLLPDGAESAPALSFSSDGNTGIYRNNSDQMRFVAGGISVFRVRSTDALAELPILFSERGAAVADIPGWGQVWVKSDTPNTLWFTDDAGNDWEIGYKGAPQRSISASDSLVLADAGKSIVFAGSSGQTLTIPANASVSFPVGTVIVVVNRDPTDSLSIAITTDTLVEAGTWNTGTRTLAAGGVATLIKTTSSQWFISGMGVS